MRPHVWERQNWVFHPQKKPFMMCTRCGIEVAYHAFLETKYGRISTEQIAVSRGVLEDCDLQVVRQILEE